MLQNFCCMRLNTAGVFIGWVGAAWSFLSTVILILALANIDDIVKMITENIKETDSENIRRMLVIFLSIQLAINVINLTASALLVAGTIKERHLMLAPWLINSGISLVFYGLYIFVIILSTIKSGDIGAVVFQTIGLILSFAFQYYIWYAIYSLYKQLQTNREQQRLLRANTQPQSPSYTKI